MPSVDHLSTIDPLEKLDTNNTVIVHVGIPPNMATFQIDAQVLVEGSPHFHQLITTMSRGQGVIEITKPHIQPEVFDAILRYIAVGSLNFDLRQDDFDVDLVLAADEFGIERLSMSVLGYMVTKRSEWLRNNIIRIIKKTFERDVFGLLRYNVVNMVISEPELLLCANDFAALDETHLSALFSHIPAAIVVWHIALQWAAAQLKLGIEPSRWLHDDKLAMSERIMPLLPLMRFNQIARNDFYEHVLPYVRILPLSVNSTALNFYLSYNERKSTSLMRPSVLLFDSNIINHMHASFIARWIYADEISSSSKRRSGPPSTYAFKLLFRLKDGLAAFSSLRTSGGMWLVVASVRGSRTLIGGLGRMGWTWTECCGSYSSSFLFSFLDGQNFENAIFGRGRSRRKGASADRKIGPCFGRRDLRFDLVDMCGHARLPPRHYERAVVDMENFPLEDLEIFEVSQGREIK